jgi:single-strand DNA-binding protein
MYETLITVVGNVVDDPKLRSTESGVEVTGFRIASTARRYDRGSDRWVDYGQLFLSVSCWRVLAVNVVASLHKGDPVLVSGRLFTRQYEREGQLRSSYEMDAVAVGPDLARGTASFQRSRALVPPTHAETDEHGLPEPPPDLGGEPPAPAPATPAPAAPAESASAAA